MSKRIKLLTIIGIIILASFLRLWQLGEVPISPDWDEVALGYDAYSFIHTGRDEFGTFLPPVLRSFDDYKPALYAYLSVPAVMIFGLNTFAVRLPSAIFGIITLLSVYFLVYELFRIRKTTQNNTQNYAEYIALLSAFLLAVSPWHIQFSRIAFETNVGLALNILTALFFIKGLRRPWLLSLAAVCSALAIYAYQSEKVFTPLLVLLLIVVYFKDIFRVPKKYLITALIAGMLTISPMFLYIVSNKGSLLRAQATLAFSDKTTFLQNNIKRLENDKKDNNILGLVLDNRRVLYLKTGLSGYLSHYNLNWLFVTGDLNRHHAPGMGLLYLWELPFVLFGIYKLFFYKDLKLADNRSAFLIFGWFLIAPIPAAFTSGVPHAVRTLNFLPTFQIFTAIGIFAIVAIISNIKYQIAKISTTYLIYSLYFLFFIVNFLYYLNQYFVQQNYFYTYDWQYGYEKLVPEVQKIKDNYSKIVVSDREPLDKSYMFFLFYLKYPPAEFQKIGQFSSGGFGNNHYFDKYEFRVIDWDIDSKERGTLFVGTPKEFPENIETVKTIYYPNGSPAIKMVEVL